MGTFFSKQKIDSNNYEKILSEYDNDIQKYEIKLSDIRVQDRRVGISWILYSTLLWIVYIVYYLYALHGHSDGLEAQLLAVSPIFLGPICIYYIRKGLKWIYNKRLNNIETNLVSLRKKQKLKVEELKKKTAYYSTKSLLERYDPASEKKKELDEQKKKKMIQEREKQKALQKQHHQQQQHQQKQPIGSENKQPMNTMMIQQPQSQQWYDKLVDALVGEVGPETKYALICIHCYAHNGLVLPQEVDNIQYTCPHCHQFNPSRKSRMLHPDGPVLPSMSLTSEPDHDGNSDLVSNSNNSKASATTAIKEKDDELRQRKITVNEQQKEKPSTA